MNYKDTLNYLYETTPMFQQVGGKAYKEGLENTYALDEQLGHPHRSFRTIHVGGTNGKGSCSHTLAAILQSAGYRVGLYTSPHLIDFKERIRINGTPIEESYVIRFVEEHRSYFEPLFPSFFELTTALAFRYFADEKVDVAVIEVGLGGRLDCTNIIRPDLCIITNISFDHTQFLGDTLQKIAGEKAGIIKEGVPVVIGKTVEETRPIFLEKAQAVGAPIVWAEEEKKILEAKPFGNASSHATGWIYTTHEYPQLTGELGGYCQLENTNTILHAAAQLKSMGYRLEEKHIRNGCEQVCALTGLMGRWQKLNEHPLVICDTGHNIGGMAYIVEQIASQTYAHLHIVIGMVNDKDIRGILKLLPQEATYYFTRANVKRALPEDELQKSASEFGLQGDHYPTVVAAVQAAQKKSLPKDFIFVGGSSFIVADLLANRDAFNFD